MIKHRPAESLDGMPRRSNHSSSGTRAIATTSAAVTGMKNSAPARSAKGTITIRAIPASSVSEASSRSRLTVIPSASATTCSLGSDGTECEVLLSITRPYQAVQLRLGLEPCQGGTGALAHAAGQAGHRSHGLQLVGRGLSEIHDLDQPFERELGMRPLLQLNYVTGLDLTIFHDPIVPAGPTAPHHRPQHSGVREGQGELEARLARLADLQQGTADPMHIPDAKIAFEHARDGQIFAEGARDKLIAMLRKFPRPGGVMLLRISVDRLFRAAVDRQIRLFVTGKTQGSDLHRAFDALLAEGARHSLRSEGSGPSNLDGEEARGDDPAPPEIWPRGAPGQTRTDTPVKELDFESSASTIPPQVPAARAC